MGNVAVVRCRAAGQIGAPGRAVGTRGAPHQAVQASRSFLLPVSPTSSGGPPRTKRRAQRSSTYTPVASPAQSALSPVDQQLRAQAAQ